VNKRVVIEPGLRTKNYWGDIWSYRGLLYYLAWRDVLIRYKQAVLGVGWSVLKPLLTIVAMCFFGMIFGSKVPSGVPRALLVAAATLPWTFFSTAFSEASNSLVANSNLLTKVYFPRIIIPLSTLIVSLIDFLISFVILLILILCYRYVPDWRICLMPLVLLLALVTAIGTSLLVAALNVKYRDFRYVVTFIVQFGLYASPIAYDSDLIYNAPNKGFWPIIKFLYPLNPMVGVIDGFRWTVLGSNVTIHMPSFLCSVAISFLFLVLGIWYFRKTEKSFADVI
jgi:lipopolysaccharide transport system permease protein